MALSTTDLVNVHVIFVFKHGKHLMYIATEYFKYCLLVNEIICEDLMKMTQIIVEIWAHLFSRISLKIAKLHDRHYYTFLYKKHFYKKHEAEIRQKLRKN